MSKFVEKFPVILFFAIFLCSVPARPDPIFPAYFQFGVGTSAYQVEGGWNASDKGESIWDRFSHTNPQSIADHKTGDIACDSYHLWETDVQILKNIGVNYYRFSLSWTRILPTGFSNHISSDGVKYYNNLINSLLENDIQPMVTIYHWDLPQKLEDLGGWANIKLVDYYAEYARIVFRLFGDRVKLWTTMNEPTSICYGTYGEGPSPLAVPGIGPYLCGKTLLLAHAKAYHIYDQEFRAEQKGRVGISLDANWAEPRTNSTEDTEAAERELQMTLGWWAHTIFSKNGDYPELIKSRIQNRSSLENFTETRLSPLDKNQIDTIIGSADFFGLNHYKTSLVSNLEYPIGDPSFLKDKGTSLYQDPNWKPSKDIVPWGFHKLIKWISKEYNNPPLYITENGYPDGGQLQDKERIIYLREYLKALLQAVNEGSDVRAYTIWSMMDNMEWIYGYTVKYGLYYVDFDSPNRTRTPKASAKFYTDVIKTRKIPDDINAYLID